MAEQAQVEAGEQHVLFEREGAVAWIGLNRPDKLNPIGTLARRQLDAALKQVERDDAVRCVVLIGSGRAFSAGADVQEMAGDGSAMRSAEDVGRVLREEYLVILQRLRSMPKPVICGMNGLAAGIGASFALACDIRIAAADAYLVEAFANLGLGPDGGVSWMLPRAIGRGPAPGVVFTAAPPLAEDDARIRVVHPGV